MPRELPRKDGKPFGWTNHDDTNEFLHKIATQEKIMAVLVMILIVVIIAVAVVFRIRSGG